MNDSVREEMKLKVSPAPKAIKMEINGNSFMPNKQRLPNVEKPSKPVAEKPDVSPKTIEKKEVSSKTAELSIKPTSPTLVEFQNKNAALPEWRLQLQNAVRKRMDNNQTEINQQVSVEAPSKPVLRTSGANALKAEPLPETEIVSHVNPTVENALRRIEQSRKRFLVEEKPKFTPAPADTRPKKDYPFYIASKNEETGRRISEPKASAEFAVKPKLVSSQRNESGDLDTNKLPPIPQAAKLSSSFEKRAVEMTKEKQRAQAAIEQEIKIIAPAPAAEIVETVEAETEEFEDYAPVSMRFNAGLFDLIIGSFASIILLSPFILLGGSWFSVGGIFAFLATCSIVMFVYLTTTIGLFGKTFGMRLFSLELIDIEENDYPTFHQAAVNSSVYLLSLAVGGLGFLTMPFNEDKRAVHDLVAGTMVVKEL